MGGEIEMHDMAGGAYGTSSGIYDEKNVVRHRGAKICCASVCLILGIAGIVIGGVLPKVVDDAVEKGVLDAARLDPDTMSDSALEKFYNGSTLEEFYLFNVTNLYDVLTKGVPINFQEVGPVKTVRYETRYNVTWDIPGSAVKYQWLTTFDVFPESLPLLDLPIIGPNIFWLAGAAGVMRQYIVNSGGPVTSQFPGNYLSESIFVTGFLGGQVLPGVLNVFKDPSGDFLKTIRGLSIATYAQFVQPFILKYNQGAGATVFDYNTALQNWAGGVSYLSNPQYYPAGSGLTNYWVGFELTTPLTSSSPLTTAQRLFDPANNYGVASVAGLTAWATLGATPSTDPTYSAQVGAIATALAITDSRDFPIIAAWIQKFAAILPGSADGVGDAYQAAVCAAVSGKIVATYAAGAALSPPTEFSKAFAGAALGGYVVKTWADIGSLQFGTGLPIAFASNPTVNVTGLGSAITDAPATPATRAKTPFSFNDGAANDPEPIEFTAGLKYYVKHNNIPPAATAGWPTGASQAILWQANPALLWADPAAAYNDPARGDASGPFINLNVPQTNALFSTLLSNGANFGRLLQSMAPMVQAYAGTFQAYADPANPASIPGANAKASSAANSTLYKFPPSMYDFIRGAGVSDTNWYAVWTYLYNYLGNELSGTLAQLDPTTGVAIQNNGLFTKHTVGEMLFGYAGRFPGVFIPGIAGPIHDPNNMDALYTADLASHVGREWVQDTGHRDITTVGQWVDYEGTQAYARACDLDDPKRTGVCGTPAAEFAHNYEVWGANATIRGSGSSLQIQPFLEAESDRLNQTKFYVSEIRRVVVLEYKKDVDVKGINLRRYGLYFAVVNESLVTPNPEKNQEVWRQGGVPDGFFSVQSYRGGYAAMASIPHWGFADPKVWAGCTCNGEDCGKAGYYDPDVHETFVDLHPLLGLTMNGAKRLQANFRIAAQELWTGPSIVNGNPQNPSYGAYPAAFTPGYPNPTTSPPGGLNYHYNNLFKNAESIYIPYYWADIHDQINDEDAQKVRNSEHAISLGRAGKKVARYVGFIAGGLAVIFSVIWLVTLCRAKSATK